jgi:16S rRNA (guanine966-N2)-methyltransferase
MGPVDLVFLDPPYGKGLGERALIALKGGGWLKPETVLVLEESSDVTLNLPDGFALDDRREYGAAAVHFLSPIESARTSVPGRPS